MKLLFLPLIILSTLYATPFLLASEPQAKIVLTEGEIDSGDTFEFVVEISIPKDKFFLWQNPGEIQGESLSTSWDFAKSKVYAGGSHPSIPEQIRIRDGQKIVFGFLNKAFLWGQLSANSVDTKGLFLTTKVKGSLCDFKEKCQFKEIMAKRFLPYRKKYNNSNSSARTILPEYMSHFPSEEQLRVHLKREAGVVKIELPLKTLSQNGTFEFFQKEKGPIEFILPGPREATTISYPIRAEFDKSKTKNYVSGLLKLSPTQAIWLEADPAIASADDFTKEHLKTYREPGFFEKYRWYFVILSMIGLGIAYFLSRKIKKTE